MIAEGDSIDRGAARLRLNLYFLFILGPAAWALATGDRSVGIAVTIGQALGIVAYAMFAMQLVLAARLHWIERPFGLDRIFHFHERMAPIAGALALAHPIVLAAGYPSWALLTGSEPWYINLGRLALLAGIAQLVVAMRFLTKMAFGAFLWTHNVLGMLIFIAGFVHGSRAGRNVFTGSAMLAWWAVFLVGLLAYLYSKTWTWTVGRRHRYRVASVTVEAPDVVTLTLTPPAGRPIPRYLPGQFQFLKLIRGRGLPAEEHPWTISSSPTRGGMIASTIKASGDFTATIAETQPGDIGVVRAPFGRFSYLLHPPTERIVFVAGGVGITPFISMLRHMADTCAGRDVLLIYASRREQDILFRRELEAIALGAAPRLTVTHILSRPEENWTGESGRISLELFQRLVGDEAPRCGWYICGPFGLTEAALGYLAEMGVPAWKIRLERFWL